jgi:hypothetical protein
MSWAMYFLGVSYKNVKFLFSCLLHLQPSYSSCNRCDAGHDWFLLRLVARSKYTRIHTVFCHQAVYVIRVVWPALHFLTAERTGLEVCRTFIGIGNEISTNQSLKYVLSQVAVKHSVMSGWSLPEMSSCLENCEWGLDILWVCKVIRADLARPSCGGWRNSWRP